MNADALLLIAVFALPIAILAFTAWMAMPGGNEGHWMDEVRRLRDRGDLATAIAVYQQGTGCTAEDAQRDVLAMTARWRR